MRISGIKTLNCKIKTKTIEIITTDTTDKVRWVDGALQPLCTPVDGILQYLQPP